MKGHSSIKRTERRTPARYRLHVGLFVALAVLVAGNTAHAQQRNVESTPQDYSITASSLGDALNQLATQSKLQIVYSPELVGGKTAPAVSGRQTWREALQKLLAGSGLEWGFVNDTTVVIRQSGNAVKPKPAVSPHRQTEKPEQKPEPTTLQGVTVTGTRIRGGSTPSLVITIGAENIREEGFADLGEVIRSLPQNFNGGQNPGVTAVSTGANNGDVTGGSALNLRGLGADASLTLLNGRRLAYDGFSQGVDISAIPVEAVERLEIVPDGASAIYGSDAVGGVANVVLKRDFDGVTLGTRYGGATEGGLATREYTATAGTTWASGGLIATFKSADVGSIYARQRSYTKDLFKPFTIYDGSDSRNGLVSVHQSMGDVAELRFDALKTKRDMTVYLPVQADSYSRYTRDTSVTLFSPSIEFFLQGDWSLTLSGAYAKDDVNTSSVGYNNANRSWEIGAEGPLFAVGGEDARLAIGAGARKYEFHDVEAVPTDSYGGDESVQFAYAELDVPFVSPASGIPGVHRLEFSAAMRGEDYASFGRVTTPKLGVIYDPTADFTLKASWGKSFKAPTQVQQSESGGNLGLLYSASAVGASGSPADATALMSFGGNPDLRPERARTWTASLALHPEALPGLDAELTWFDIDYTDRVIVPINYPYLQALSDPAYADFVDRSPTPEQIQKFFAVYGAAFYNLSNGTYDSSKVVAIIHDEFVNAAQQRIKGLDLSGSYRFDLGNGRLTVRGSASWLDSVQTTSAGQPEQTLAGTLFYPARLKGRVGAVWTSGGFSASGFVNYTGGVANRLATVTEKAASFTTLDTTINYDLGERAGALSGLTLGLSVQNLLNRAPPLYTSALATIVPYDPANYSAIGRFVSVSVSKHW